MATIANEAGGEVVPTATREWGRWGSVAACAAIAVVCVAVYWPVLGNGFLSWDDDGTISANPRVDPPTVRGLAHLWSHSQMHLYVPLTYTVWWGLAAGWRAVAGPGGMLPPGLFHGTSLVLHVAASCVVFAVLRQLVRKRLAAALGALLFAVHPVQVEAVAWASGLKDVLGGLLMWTAVWLYVRFARGSGGRWAYAAATGTFVLATLAKPGVVVAPVIVALIDLAIVGRPVGRVARSVGPWLVPALACAAWTARVQPAGLPGLPVVAVVARPVVAADALAFYAGKLVWPVGLTVDHGRRPDEVVARGGAGWRKWPVPVAIAAATGAAWYALRKRGARELAGLVLAAVLILPICVAPVLGLKAFHFQYYSTVAEHYIYPGMVGPALLVAALVAAGRGWVRVAGIVATAAVLLVFGVVAHARTWDWQENVSLFTRALEVNPRSFAAASSLAGEYVRKGEPARAVPFARLAIELRPGDARGYSNLGAALARAGDLAGAVRAARAAVERSPEDALYLNHLAAYLLDSGAAEESLTFARRAVRADPGDAAAHTNLGIGLMRGGDFAGAEAAFVEALRFAPESEKALRGLEFARRRRP